MSQGSSLDTLSTPNLAEGMTVKHRALGLALLFLYPALLHAQGRGADGKFDKRESAHFLLLQDVDIDEYYQYFHKYNLDEYKYYIYVYNLGTGLFEAPLTNPWVSNEIFCGAAFGTGLIPVELQSFSIE